jgi:predicted DNA-binding protein
MKNRKKTSFTLDIETMQGLSHLAKINKRSMANMIDILVSEKLNERENEFFKHMNKKEKNTRK